MQHKRLRDVLDWRSKIRYAIWKLCRSKSILNCTLVTGEHLLVRPRPSSDLDTANEVFASEVYRLPVQLDDVNTIIDLGSNVGYTLLHWSRQFPKSEITGVEPHPVHFELMNRHIQLNRLENRIRMIEAAAGVRTGLENLTDCESGSKIVAAENHTGIQVKVIDIYDILLGKPIDILKMDIEGSEYEILGDSRFLDVNARVVIIEWHKTNTHLNGCNICSEMVQNAGYNVKLGLQTEQFGIIYGSKQNFSKN